MYVYAGCAGATTLRQSAAQDLELVLARQPYRFTHRWSWPYAHQHK